MRVMFITLAMAACYVMLVQNSKINAARIRMLGRHIRL